MPSWIYIMEFLRHPLSFLASVLPPSVVFVLYLLPILDRSWFAASSVSRLQRL